MKPVLIVDDDEAILRLIAQVVSNLGMVFLVASNDREALAMAYENSLSMIIADHQLGPDSENGATTIRMVEKIQPEIATILMSASNVEDEDLEQFDAFVRKPFDLEEFTETITSLLR